MPVKHLSPDERRTLKSLADPGCTEGAKRGHLEKLARLDLIEPCPQGVCMTPKGKKALVGAK